MSKTKRLKEFLEENGITVSGAKASELAKEYNQYRYPLGLCISNIVENRDMKFIKFVKLR
jgi:hypothetical protein